MSEADKYPPGKVPTPADTLEQQIMNSTFPKNEREWWAAHEIEELRQSIAAKDAEIKKLREALKPFVEEGWHSDPAGSWEVVLTVEDRERARALIAPQEPSK